MFVLFIYSSGLSDKLFLYTYILQSFILFLIYISNNLERFGIFPSIILLKNPIISLCHSLSYQNKYIYSFGGILVNSFHYFNNIHFYIFTFDLSLRFCLIYNSFYPVLISNIKKKFFQGENICFGIIFNLLNI